MKLIMPFVFDTISRMFICVFLGDFFKDPLPDADLYVLARILHDWTDQRCTELLQRVHKACRPGLSIHVTGLKEPPSERTEQRKSTCLCVCARVCLFL